jgi:mono/diheme cytochrome c family protein
LPKPEENAEMKILLTIVACLVVLALAVVGFIYSGIYDVAALDPDIPIVAWALHKTSDQSVDARLGGIVVPPGLDRPEIVQAGGKLFRTHCSVCHGGPGLQATDIAQGLNPVPPNLFNPRRHPHMDEMYWFIKNGVKMTAMPGFGKTHSDDEIWSLAAFLRTGPGMTPEDFAAKTGSAVPAASVPDSSKASGG